MLGRMRFFKLEEQTTYEGIDTNFGAPSSTSLPEDEREHSHRSSAPVQFTYCNPLIEIIELAIESER